jgi:hypothetical protein
MDQNPTSVVAASTRIRRQRPSIRAQPTRGACPYRIDGQRSIWPLSVAWRPQLPEPSGGWGRFQPRHPSPSGCRRSAWRDPLRQSYITGKGVPGSRTTAVPGCRRISATALLRLRLLIGRGQHERQVERKAYHLLPSPLTTRSMCAAQRSSAAPASRSGTSKMINSAKSLVGTRLPQRLSMRFSDRLSVSTRRPRSSKHGLQIPQL